jgi:hypothetical protein
MYYILRIIDRFFPGVPLAMGCIARGTDGEERSSVTLTIKLPRSIKFHRHGFEIFSYLPALQSSQISSIVVGTIILILHGEPTEYRMLRTL